MTLPDSISVDARAKVNLSLRILAREASGYHTIETVFCLITLADQITVERTAPGVSLEAAGSDLGPTEENLAVRAARAVLGATGDRFGVRVHLAKQIPPRAGLGGGSSDAAAVLMAVNRLAGDAVPHAELLQLGARLGSDVPFFLSGAPLALAWGRGDRLLRLPPLPERPVLLAVPHHGVATPDAYAWWDQAFPEAVRRGPVVLDGEVFSSWGSAARAGGNDFETVVFGRRPDIRALFENMTLTHPLLCRMAGSGAAVFAVYRDEPARHDAALQLGTRDWGLIETATIAA